MKQPSRALQAEWRKRLRASGFDDLESSGGELSNRGTVTYSDHGREPVPVEQQVARRETEAAYYDQAREILRTHRFRNATERDIWQRHADCQGMHPIADALGMPYHRVREVVQRVLATAGAKAKQAKGRKCLASLVRRSDLTVMGQLGVILVRHLRRTRTPCSTSASG